MGSGNWLQRSMLLKANVKRADRRAYERPFLGFFSFVNMFLGHTQQEEALFRKIHFIISLLRNKADLDAHYKVITKEEGHDGPYIARLC